MSLIDINTFDTKNIDDYRALINYILDIYFENNSTKIKYDLYILLLELLKKLNMDCLCNNFNSNNSACNLKDSTADVLLELIIPERFRKQITFKQRY